METELNNKELFKNIERNRTAKKLREIPEKERTLKTLKDIIVRNGNSNIGKSKDKEINAFKEKLKYETVKWVKMYKNDIIDHQDQIEFIKIFFNLTEEDLK